MDDESETQLAPQRVCPIVHPEMHVRVAALQKGVAPEHTVPHAPQLRESELVSTQKPPQFVVLVGQPQRPIVHVSPALHTRPHAPQLVGSDVKSRHVPEHSVRPPGQPQVPLLQL